MLERPLLTHLALVCPTDVSKVKKEEGDDEEGGSSGPVKKEEDRESRKPAASRVTGRKAKGRKPSTDEPEQPPAPKRQRMLAGQKSECSECKNSLPLSIHLVPLLLSAVFKGHIQLLSIQLLSLKASVFLEAPCSAAT
jgi:hypothetical protein